MDGLLRSIKSCVRFLIEFLIEFFFWSFLLLLLHSFFLFRHYHHYHHQSPPLSSFVIDFLHLVDPGVAVFGGVG